MRRAIACSLLVVLAGCGGGGGTSPAPTSKTNTAASVSGTLTLSIPLDGGRAASLRRAAFVSPNATSAVVAVNGGPTNGGTATTVDVSSSSTICTTSGSTRTCAVPLSAPVGQDTIAVSLFVMNVSTPVLLGQGSNTVTVVAGTPFALTVGINPAIAGIAGISPTNYTNAFTYGKAGTLTLTLTFADPSGATITGSGNVPNFLTPVTLTSSDPHVTFSPSTLTTPGQTFTVSYDGSAAIASTVSVGLQVGSVKLAQASFSLPGLVVTRYNLAPISSPTTVFPAQIVVGPDGNIWWAEELTNRIGHITPGTASTYPAVQTGITYIANTAGGSPSGIAKGGDGNIWYSTNSNKLVRLNPATGAAPSSGPATVTIGASGTVGRLATDSQGNVWYVNGSSGGSVGYVDMTTFTVHNFTPLPTPNSLLSFSGLTLGADNAMYFTELTKIGRVTTPANGTAGAFTEFPVPNTMTGVTPLDLAAGPDGNVWVSVFASNANNQFFASFVPGASTTITEYPNVLNPAAFANLVTMFAGADGKMTIAEGGGAASIPPANPTAAFPQFFTDNGQTSMVSCVAGPDGNDWCTAYGSAAQSQGFIDTTDAILTWKPR